MNMSITSNNRGRVIASLLLIVAQMAFVSARAADTNDVRGQLSRGDFKFAKAAACGGAAEVSLGKLAAQISSNPSVRDFGQKMVTDHGKAGQDLVQLASRKGAMLPAEPSAKQQAEIDRLSKLAGADFDTAYIKLMVRDHKADEKEFKRASEKVEDTDLKGFAASVLLIVQEHLKMAEDIRDNLKSNSNTNR
jgi:putative membrane protein